MDNNPDTYGRTIQLGASRRRLEDAEALYNQERWNGAIYMGGYAIECALKSLLCHEEDIVNFKKTKVFKRLKGSNLHDLEQLLEASYICKGVKDSKKDQSLKKAWDTVKLWQNDKLRYSDKKGDKIEASKFIYAVKILHGYFLAKLQAY